MLVGRDPEVLTKHSWLPMFEVPLHANDAMRHTACSEEANSHEG